VGRNAAQQVDWTQRDSELTAGVTAAVARLRAYRPFRRITVTGLEVELNMAGILYRARGRLPAFEAMARKISESYHDFAARKVAEFRRLYPCAPRWKIYELASVPPSLRKAGVIPGAPGS